MAKGKAVKRPDLVKAFEAVLGCIGEQEFICCALSYLEANGLIHYRTEQDARRIIHSRLEGEYVLDDWIKRFHPHLVTEMHEVRNRVYHAKMLATRKAWLKSLIKEFGG